MTARILDMPSDVRTRLIRVALGDEPAEVVVRGARVVNVFTREIVAADVVVAAGRIAAVGDCRDQLIGPDTEIIDAGGRIAGLLSPEPLEVVGERLAALERVLIEKLGCSIGYRPIYALNFLCLPNIPDVGFTDRGIILTETMEIIGPLAAIGA